MVEPGPSIRRRESVRGCSEPDPLVGSVKNSVVTFEEDVAIYELEPRTTGFGYNTKIINDEVD